jgi:multiple sugar transport system substrate-binding protein
MKLRLRMSTLALVATVALLSACGGQTNTPAPAAGATAAPAAGAPATNATTAPASGDQVTLTYGMWDQNQQPAMQKTIDEFQKLHPNIKVEIQLTPWANYWDKLKTAAAGGEINDVLWMNGPYFPFYASKGLLLDLQPYMDKDKFPIDQYPNTILGLYKYKDHYYAGPRDFDTIALFYNKDLFDAAGVKYPDDSWDWNTMRDAAKKLTKAPDQWGMVVWNSGQEQYMNFLYGNGGAILSDDKTKCLLDQPQSIQAFQFLVDLIYKDKISQLPQAMGDDPTVFFQQGKAAMITTGSWTVGPYSKDLKFKWSIAPLPKSPNTGNRVSVIHGLGNVISAKTKHPDQAWEFVKYMAIQPGQQILADTGTQIPTLAGLAKNWQDAHKDEPTQIFLDATKYSKEYPASVSFAEWNDVLNKGLTQIYNNQTPVEQGLKDICTQMNPILATDK